MKVTLLCSMLFLSLAGKSQVADTATQRKLSEAGKEFIKFQHQAGIGGAITLLGGGCAWAAGSQSDSKNNKGTIYACVGVGIVGLIVSLAAITHVGKAGIILSGNSIIVPLHK